MLKLWEWSGPDSKGVCKSDKVIIQVNEVKKGIAKHIIKSDRFLHTYSEMWLSFCQIKCFNRGPGK